MGEKGEIANSQRCHSSLSEGARQRGDPDRLTSQPHLARPRPTEDADEPALRAHTTLCPTAIIENFVTTGAGAAAPMKWVGKCVRIRDVVDNRAPLSSWVAGMREDLCELFSQELEGAGWELAEEQRARRHVVRFRRLMVPLRERVGGFGERHDSIPVAKPLGNTERTEAVSAPRPQNEEPPTFTTLDTDRHEVEQLEVERSTAESLEAERVESDRHEAERLAAKRLEIDRPSPEPLAAGQTTSTEPVAGGSWLSLPGEHDLQPAESPDVSLHGRISSYSYRNEHDARVDVRALFREPTGLRRRTFSVRREFRRHT